MAHMSRREYRMKHNNNSQSAMQSKTKYENAKSKNINQFRKSRRLSTNNISIDTSSATQANEQHLKLNFGISLRIGPIFQLL